MGCSKSRKLIFIKRKAGFWTELILTQSQKIGGKPPESPEKPAAEHVSASKIAVLVTTGQRARAAPSVFLVAEKTAGRGQTEVSDNNARRAWVPPR
jgi:hypothetical protein